MASDPQSTTAAHAALAHFTECQLATLEGLPARTSARARRRQQQIADEMVETCRALGIRPAERWRGEPNTPRLRKLLEATNAK